MERPYRVTPLKAARHKPRSDNQDDSGGDEGNDTQVTAATFNDGDNDDNDRNVGDDVKAGDDQSIDTNDAGIDDNDTDGANHNVDVDRNADNINSEGGGDSDNDMNDEIRVGGDNGDINRGGADAAKAVMTEALMQVQAFLTAGRPFNPHV